ncbi:MAG TPA: ABC transporter permease [Woeseiaceae bacterium]|nr:ABC transporter permease [Woeseiaceae bacterium]
MRILLQSMRKDLSRWRRDSSALLTWILIPFVIGGLMTFVVGDGAKPHGVLLLVDQDESLLSGLVAGAYTRGELGELLSVEKVSLEEGTERINAGDASGLLLIPEGFEDAFFDAEPVTLTLRTNPSQTILPGIIRDVTEIVLDAGFYAQKLFGEEIRSIRQASSTNEKGTGPSAELVSAVAVAVRQRIVEIDPYLNPLALEVEVAEPVDTAPVAPMGLLFLPGIILMAVMFSANGLAADYWVEREQGTLRRIHCAPGQLGAFVAGKGLAAIVVIGLIGGLTLLVGSLYHGVGTVRFLPSLLWISVSGLALFAWFSVLQMLGSTQRAANILSSLLLFPLLMAGGSFFPFAALPDWIAAVGRHTPNGFVVDRLTTEITSTAAWAIDAQSWLIVLLMAASGLAVTSWRLKSGFARA